MKIETLFKSLFLCLLLSPLSVIAQNKSAAGPKKVLDAFITATTKSGEMVYLIPNAKIIIEDIRTLKTRNKASGGPAEKTQFDLILKSLKSNNIETSTKGEFRIAFPPKAYRNMPDDFIMDLKIKPPRNFDGNYRSENIEVNVDKSDGPTFEFILAWKPVKEQKPDKGSFVVIAKSQY